TEIVTCPSCQRQLQIPENFLGQLVQCPDCRHEFTAEPPVSAMQSGAPSPSRNAPREDRPSRPRYDDDREDDDLSDLSISRRRGHMQPRRATLVLVMGILSVCCVF